MKIVAIMKQNKPATATVVNLGVSFLHISETENIEKQTVEDKPNRKTINEFFSLVSIAIIANPNDAITIDIHTFNETFSLRNKKANKAVKKGIAARLSKEIAAFLIVIE